MAVILSDGMYQVAHRAHPGTKDAHGKPVPSAPGTLGTARPGASTEQADGSWTLRLDPAEYPLWAGDEVHGPGGQRWVVTGQPRYPSNPAASDVDYVAATAVLRNVHI
jgi:hypothetical protein